MIPTLDRDIATLYFRYDPIYCQGSLGLFVHLQDRTKVLTIVAREDTPNPGTLVDKTYVDKTYVGGNDNLVPAYNGYLEKYPVTRYQLGDVEEVLVGAGATKKESMQNMRKYQITRKPQGNLEGQYLGYETVDPTQITLRTSPPADLPCN